MTPNRLGLAIAAALVVPVLAAPDGDRPHIPARMELRASNAAASEYELLIYGDIGESWWGESVTAKSVVEQLNALSASVTQINVRINSYGGSVADGLAIYNALRRHSARKAVTVDGVAMSSASLVAMAGDEVAMPDASMLMIHAPWTYATGNAEELRNIARVLDTYADAMAGAYARKTGKPREDMLALLLDGQDHYYTGRQALDAGFADTLIDSVIEEDEDAAADASALLSGLDRFTARTTAAVAAQVATAARRAPPQPASPANPEETDMPLAQYRNRRLHDPVGAGNGSSGSAPAPAAAPAPTTPAPAAPAAAAPPAADRAAILAAETQRRADIRARFAPHQARTDVDVAALQRQCEDDVQCTPEAAGLRLLDALGRTAEPLASTRVEPGRQDAQATFRAGVAQAMLHRFNPSAHAIDEPARPFAFMRLIDVARACAERAGIRTAGRSPNEIAVQALHSTSDFPYILENIVTRTLRAGYEGTVRTFVPWCRRATLPDFREVKRVQLGGAPSLKKVLEGGEYEQGTIGDGAEKYSLAKYGRIVAITWEVIINDDLDALTRIPQMFGRSAADLESDIVYGILTANAAMADTVALFHASHGNLGTAGAISDTTLGEMQEKMLLQKGIEGRHITVRPEFLIVPPRQLVAAQKAVALPIVPTRTSDANTFYQALSVIAEPRLQDASATNWYGAASPAAIDTIEYAYLEGHEGPFTETRNGFETDGVQVKCRQVFGAKAVDYRGLFKNPQ